MAHDALHPPRRSALAGLVAGAGGVLAAGCTASDTLTAQGRAPLPWSSATGSTGGATPGAMTLFKDPSYDFSALWALGGAGFSGSEVGEVLTAVNSINKAGLSAQTYVDTFRSLGDRLLEAPEGSKPDRQTRRLRALRAAQYYALALFSTSTYGPYGVPAALERGWNALVYDGPGQGTAALREPCRLHTTFYPGQPRRMFDKLAAPKDYVKLTAATGAQLHCSPMALQQHCDIVSDWLQETLPGR